MGMKFPELFASTTGSVQTAAAPSITTKPWSKFQEMVLLLVKRFFRAEPMSPRDWANQRPPPSIAMVGIAAPELFASADGFRLIWKAPLSSFHIPSPKAPTAWQKETKTRT